MNKLVDGHRRIITRRYRMPSGHESDWDIIGSGQTVAVVAVTDDDQTVLVLASRLSG
ncbi:hypothetical protein ACIHDR_43550 [Nocardia sp. NPDC052278]|uniref:hypothetical protein n=1 Tax=unclassified Nocardia TaxID=2637762 RepID=UPI00368CA3BF